MFKKVTENVLYRSEPFSNMGECLFEAGYFYGRINSAIKYFNLKTELYYKNHSWNPFKEEWVFEIVGV